jgi:hypothetical protein
MKKLTLKESIVKMEKILDKADLPEQTPDTIDDELHRLLFLQDCFFAAKFATLGEIKELINLINPINSKYKDLPF